MEFDLDSDKYIKKTVPEWLDSVDYSNDAMYVPSLFALQFVAFIKMVNETSTGAGTVNKTPVVHYRMIDTMIIENGLDTLNLCHRGIAKSTLKEFLLLYIAANYQFPSIGTVPFAIYVSDSMDNGVKKMRKNLEYRWENSTFLREVIPYTNFTEDRWEFKNKNNQTFVVSGYGAKALSLNTLVHVPGGKKTIAAVKVGDMVMGADGYYTEVVGKSEIFNRPMYRITLEDGRHWTVCEEHINPVSVFNQEKQLIEDFNLFTHELVQGEYTEYFVRNCAAIMEGNKLPLPDAYRIGCEATDGIKQSYLECDVITRHQILKGIMDTRAHIDKGVVYIHSLSKVLLHDIRQLVYSLGGHSYPVSDTEIRIHLDKSLFKEKRHLNNSHIRVLPMVRIKSIERVADEPSQCIAVSNEEKQFIVNQYVRTHNTGVRGTREQGSRPVLALLDDLVSDKDARSPTVIASIEDTVYNALTHALEPGKRKIIWSGTPFNAADPLYKAVESGGWNVNVFPVCEQFPCTEEEFRGSWEDRFTYAYVQSEYIKAKLNNKIESFNQELMLRIMSDDDRSIQDHDIKWYDFNFFQKYKHTFNYYITTDFATSEKAAADFTVISVWGLNSSNHWFWVDGICARQLMDSTLNDLFRLCKKWKPLSVGIEVSGQQGGFIPWIEKEMMERNIFFSLASEGNNSRPGIRPNTDKMTRFSLVLPWFKQGRVHFPLHMKGVGPIKEAVDELEKVTPKGFKSKHDDFIDTISMLSSINAWSPSDEGGINTEDVSSSSDLLWGESEVYDLDSSSYDSYLI